MSAEWLNYPETVWTQTGGAGSSMWKLTIVDDEGKRTDLLLSRGEYTIGRDEGNTVRLTDRNISRKHMVLRKAENVGWTIEDLNSYNGVFVNGSRVSGAQPLSHGDLVQVGDYRLEVTDESRLQAEGKEEAGAEASAPPTARLLDRPDRLIVVDGAAAGTEYPLENERTVIGRAEDADISINHSSVSRVHAEMVKISDGVYEVFDRGSSNGIRVNGIKAERRVIEDDDELELGDVRLRFVARGRIFHPGMAPAAQAYGATDVFATGRHAPQRRGGLGVMVAVGAVLGILAVVGFVALRPRSTTPTGSSPTETASDDQSVLAEAKRLAAAGDLAGAHQKLSAMPESSPLRQSKDVFDIESRWADDKFAQAATQSDVGKRKALLGEVATAKLVDAERRKRAADQLAMLDQGGTDPNALPVAAQDVDGAAAPAGTLLPNGLAPNPFDETKKEASSSTPPRTAATTAEAEPKAPASPPTAATPKSAATDDARKEALKGSEGEEKARRMLEPRVWSGRATVDEIKMLRAICRHQHDSACASRCTAMLKEKGQ